MLYINGSKTWEVYICNASKGCSVCNRRFPKCDLQVRSLLSYILNVWVVDAIMSIYRNMLELRKCANRIPKGAIIVIEILDAECKPLKMFKSFQDVDCRGRWRAFQLELKAS